jgi:hypothetical protein
VHTTHAAAENRSVGVAGALVSGPDGKPKHLHLSVPYVSLDDRSSRAWIRAQINSQSAAVDVPVTIHRTTRNGKMTNKRGWLAWL